jgi:tripartite ATP-independent transporter DctP family solute receptor
MTTATARSAPPGAARTLALSLGLALALACGAALGQAPKTNTLKFNHVLGPKEPYHQGFLDWAKAVEARTDGGLKIEVFHSAQLGKEEDIIEQIRQGANIGQNTDSARMGNYVPGIAVMNGPYFVETLEDVAKLRKAPTVVKWQEELATKFGLKVLSFSWVQGYRHFFTNKPVRRPEDLKGQRIRTPPAPIWQESIRALGATPVAMAFGEMYPGLQQKAIDGVELVYNNIPGGRFYEVLKFANETRHIMLINFEVVSAKWFDSLPKEHQAILVEECDKAGEATSRRIFKLEDEVEAQLRSRGMTIVEDVDLAAFRKAGEKAYEVLKIQDAKNAVYREIGKK